MRRSARGVMMLVSSSPLLVLFGGDGGLVPDLYGCLLTNVAAVTAEDVAVGDLMQDVDWAMLMDVMDDFDWEGSAKAGGEPSLSMPG